MCMVVNSSGGSGQVTRDSQVMAAKKNPKADVYTKKEVSKLKSAAKSRKSKI